MRVRLKVCLAIVLIASVVFTFGYSALGQPAPGQEGTPTEEDYRGTGRREVLTSPRVTEGGAIAIDVVNCPEDTVYRQGQCEPKG